MAALTKELSILVVEGDRRKGDMMFHNEWLRRDTHDVHDYLTGTDAFLAVLHNLKYDIAVLSRDKWYDIMPPEHIIILSKHLHPSVPIISTSRRYQAKSKGADAFLKVPYTYGDLDQCIGQLRLAFT